MGSKHLIALPDLSQAPKIKYLHLDGCVNLFQIYASTILSNLQCVWMGCNGPRKMNIGGSVRGNKSGSVIVHNYLNLNKLSFNEVRMKVLVCGNIICGVEFKHVVVGQLEGIAGLRSLLPFLRNVEWFESSKEFGDDVNQQYDYDCCYGRH